MHVSLRAIFLLSILVPAFTVEAGFLSALLGLFTQTSNANTSESKIDSSLNSQNMALLQATLSSSPVLGRGGGDIVIVDSALLPEVGPAGTIADAVSAQPISGEISVYVVRKNDTISEIAAIFGVSVNTIMWANDLKSGIIHEGQTLVILPISGVRHTVKKGDTVASITKLYKGDLEEVLEFNNLTKDATLTVGDEVIVPNGKLATTPSTSVSPKTTTSTLRGTGGPDLSGYYIRPVYGGVISQGLHGYNGVDLAAPRGTTIVSSAGGVVIVSRNSGWNGGYGKYIVIQHPNGTQTLYAHLDNAVAHEGAEVEQGQLIGYSGSTGKSTGPHLHFEVRGAKNPFAR